MSKQNGGCINRLFGLFIFLIVCALGGILYSATQGQDLSDIDGSSNPARPRRDLKKVFEESQKRSFAVTLSEKDLNEWLASRIQLNQRGLLAPWVKLKKVCVRLREGVAEIIIEREIRGHSITTSMFVQVKHTSSEKSSSQEIQFHGGDFIDDLELPKRGGRFGKLTIPQGFLYIVMSDFRKLNDVLKDEIELGIKGMRLITIEDKRIVLDPRLPKSSSDPVF